MILEFRCNKQDLIMGKIKAEAEAALLDMQISFKSKTSSKCKVEK